MNRKNFLSAFLPATLATTFLNKAHAKKNLIKNTQDPNIQIPFLKQGDTVGITCTASAVELKKLNGLQALKDWGLKVQIGNTVGKRWQRFAGTDDERAIDLQAMLDDENIKAIFFAKGGYGTMRMIDKINWTKFLQNPKWLIGFSDVTTIHLHIQANYNIPTLHADTVTNFTNNKKDFSANTLHDILFGYKTEYSFNGYELNKEGTTTGKLIGGNLSLIQACAGSKSDINTEGKILLIEDVSEYKYTIDRMLMNLKRSGKLDNLAGLVVGMFTATKTKEEEEFTASIEEIVYDKIKEYNYPVCFHFPAGHIANNHALKLGVEYTLNVTKQNVTLFENVTSDFPKPTVPSKIVEAILGN